MVGGLTIKKTSISLSFGIRRNLQSVQNMKGQYLSYPSSQTLDRRNRSIGRAPKVLNQ